MGEAIDPAFIQEPEHRPKQAITQAEGIPLIDLSPLTSPTAKQALIVEIRESSKNWGFFQVINHGVPLEKRERLELPPKFFSLSIEEKRKVRRDEKHPLGYYDAEHTTNVRDDWKEVFDFTVKDPIWLPISHEPDDHEVTQHCNQWPEYPPELR